MKNLLQKVALTLVTLVVTFSSVFAPVALAGGGINPNLSFDSGSNEFTVTVDAGEDTYPVAYILAYSTPDQINGFINFDYATFTHADLYAGTCSDAICTPDNVYRALLKVVTSFDDEETYWFTSKRYENGSSFDLVMQDNGSEVFDLTDEEIAWLQGANPSPTPTPAGEDMCPNIEGVQTSMPHDHHYDASGKNCVQFQYGGPQSSSNSSGSMSNPTPKPNFGGTGNQEVLAFLNKDEEEVEVTSSATPSASPEVKGIDINVPDQETSSSKLWWLLLLIPLLFLLVFLARRKKKTNKK